MKIDPKLEDHRTRVGEYASNTGDPFGAFEIHGPSGAHLMIIATDGKGDHTIESTGWEHVSVSVGWRPPNWKEMCFIKDLFWEPEDCVVQFHPPKSEYVNCHPYCLHLWRCTSAEFPRPPAILVGPKVEPAS